MPVLAILDQTNTIINRIVVNDPQDWSPDGEDNAAILESDEAPMAIGGTYIDGVYAPPVATPVEPLPPVVPATISKRQFYQQAAVDGFITTNEALAAVTTGAIPEALDTFIMSLPQGDQFGARMLLAGATEFQRNHPMTTAIAAAWEMDSAATDQFFTAAAAL